MGLIKRGEALGLFGALVCLGFGGSRACKRGQWREKDGVGAGVGIRAESHARGRNEQGLGLARAVVLLPSLPMPSAQTIELAPLASGPGVAVGLLCLVAHVL